MKKITITVVFKMWGHGFIDVIPTSYAEWDPTESDSRDYNLDAGNYTILYDTVTGDGGTITVTDGDEIIATDTLLANQYSGHFRITI